MLAPELRGHFEMDGGAGHIPSNTISSSLKTFLLIRLTLGDSFLRLERRGNREEPGPELL